MPIRTTGELDEAIAAIDSLLDKEDTLSESDQQRLEELSDSVRRYESSHYPAKKVSKRDLLHHLLEIHGLTHTKLAEMVGVSASVISAFLAGRSPLPAETGRKLAERFCLRPSTFVQGKSSTGIEVKSVLLNTAPTGVRARPAGVVIKMSTSAVAVSMAQGVNLAYRTLHLAFQAAPAESKYESACL